MATITFQQLVSSMLTGNLQLNLSQSQSTASSSSSRPVWGPSTVHRSITDLKPPVVPPQALDAPVAAATLFYLDEDDFPITQIESNLYAPPIPIPFTFPAGEKDLTYTLSYKFT